MKEGEKRRKLTKLEESPAKEDTAQSDQMIEEPEQIKEIDDGELKSYDALSQPTNEDFCPIKDSPQKKGQRMPFGFVVTALTLIEQQSGKGSRDVIINIITNVFRSALANFATELADILYFLILKLAPDFAAMETGVGEGLTVNAIAKACGKTPKEIKALKKEHGDLGTVVALSKRTTGTLGGFFAKKTPPKEKNGYLKFNDVF